MVRLNTCHGVWWIQVPILVILVFGGLCVCLFFVQLQLAANIDFGTGPTATAYGNITSQLPAFFGGGFGIIASVPDVPASDSFSDYSDPHSDSDSDSDFDFEFDPDSQMQSSVTTDPETVFSNPSYFEASCMLARRLQQVPKIANMSIANVAYIPFLNSVDACFTPAEALTMLSSTAGNGAYYQYFCGEGSHLLNQTTNRTITTVFDPEFNPFSTESEVGGCMNECS